MAEKPKSSSEVTSIRHKKDTRVKAGIDRSFALPETGNDAATV